LNCPGLFTGVQSIDIAEKWAEKWRMRMVQALAPGRRMFETCAFIALETKA